MLHLIQSLTDELHATTTKRRRHLHAHPELSFHEKETCRWIGEELTAIGLEPEVGVAGTGVVAVIKGQAPDSAVVALRGDMDALPITEANDVPYKSKNPGVMHACGHDVHTASLLGVAQILHRLQDQLVGTVKLIFQPGEEKLPGGASMLIKEGVLESPRPSSIIGQHVLPQLSVGKMGFREGKYMASTDEIYARVIGLGGHGAMPEKCIDPVAITAQLITALQQVVSRMADPKMPTVLTFGKVLANGATNVIPNEVYLEGTLRTFSEQWREEAQLRIRKVAEGVVEALGGKIELEIRKGYPYLENNPALTRRARLSAETYIGKENVVDLDLWLAAEDFAYYSQHIPGCFYRLGTGNAAKGITSGVHTPTFDIDEDALKIAPGMMAWLAVQELEHLAKQ